MIHITLPDGSIKQFEKNATPMDVAKSISEGFARNVISANFNDVTIETSTPLYTNGSLVLYTWNDKEGKKAYVKVVKWRQIKDNKDTLIYGMVKEFIPFKKTIK